MLWCSTCSFFLNVGIERAVNMHYLMLLKPSHCFARRGFMWVYREEVSSKNTSPANSVFYIESKLFKLCSQSWVSRLYIWGLFLNLKKLIAPFHEWDSAVSRLQSHHKKTVYYPTFSTRQNNFLSNNQTIFLRALPIRFERFS